MIRRKAACASCLKKRRKMTQFDCEFRNARRSAEMSHVMESASSRMITLGNVEAPRKCMEMLHAAALRLDP